MSKVISILIIFLGEILSILAEIIAARNFSVPESRFVNVFFKVFPIILIGSILLLSGYMLGLRSFKNIWIVSAISITSIIITEPIINYIITHQTPTTGSLIGLILGVLGLLSALIF